MAKASRNKAGRSALRVENPTKAVYWISGSSESTRPYVSSDFACFPGSDEWKKWEFFAGLRSVKKYVAPKLNTGQPHPLATDYDFYDLIGKGLVSARAKEVLEPSANEYFEFLDASLYGKPYYLLRIKKTLGGVLDTRASEFDEDEDVPGGIRFVEKAVFITSRVPDPAFFCVQEGFDGPFGTDTVA